MRLEYYCQLWEEKLKERLVEKYWSWMDRGFSVFTFSKCVELVDGY